MDGTPTRSTEGPGWCTTFAMPFAHPCLRSVPLVLLAVWAWQDCGVAPAQPAPQVVLPLDLGVPRGGRTVPTQAYDLALLELSGGDFSAALQIALREYQGGVRAGSQRWIDSIASATVVGECQYELGNFREAVSAYDEALLLFATHPDWLLSVQFPPQGLRPLAQQRVATWGRSLRNASPAGIPDTMSIRQGGADQQQVLQKGGVLTAPANYPIRPQEIIKSIVISLYRRTEILGELSREGASLDEAAKALIRRPAQPNHYSQSWIDIALGTAYWAQGKPDQAMPLLNRGLLVGNQFDHPLTSWGLIVLGRIAMESDQPAAAATLFEEATYTAADYGDTRALEEAFRLAFTAHMAAGTRGVPPSIAAACEWARRGPAAISTRLLAMQAEAQTLGGNARAAVASLGNIDGRLMRGDLGRGSCGAQAAYAAAMASYTAANAIDGDAELERALRIARTRTPRLFQTQRLVELVVAGSSFLSDRQADALFAKLLGDPIPRDFATDPIGTLAAMTAPRDDAFEAWISVASRRGNDATLVAAESRYRARWLAVQPQGGRRTAIEQLLGANPDTLPRAEAASRAALLAIHPDLARALDDSARLRTILTTAMLGQAGDAAHGEPNGNPQKPAIVPLPGAAPDWQAYAKLALARSKMVAQIAAGRDPTAIDFPPMTPPAEIRRRLAAKQMILSFHWTSAGLWGVLESHDRVATWQVKQPAALAKEIASLAKAIGLYDPVAAVSTERLLETDWHPAAERVERLLFEQSKIELGVGIEELIIVPDGLLWYLPFELLPVGSARQPAANEGPEKKAPGESLTLLRDACQIRYCPTRSLAVVRYEPSRASGPIGIHAGKFFRSDKPEAAQEIVTRLSASLEHVCVLPTHVSGVPSCLIGGLCDTLVVFDELFGEGPMAARPLIGGSSAKGGATFGEWVATPHKRPQCVVLPGMQTAMAGGLSKLPAQPGDDLFLATTDLLAAGGRRAIVSRWRMGGKVAVDLVEEFLRDVATASGDEANATGPRAAESWHRAVDLVTAEQPDLDREPRIKQSAAKALAKNVLPDAKHPFFWAGYVLIDCGSGRYPDAPPPGKAPAPAQPIAAPPVAPQAAP